LNKANENRGDEEFVRRWVEEQAEIGHLLFLTGKETVEHIGESGQKEDSERKDLSASDMGKEDNDEEGDGTDPS